MLVGNIHRPLGLMRCSANRENECFSSRTAKKSGDYGNTLKLRFQKNASSQGYIFLFLLHCT